MGVVVDTVTTNRSETDTAMDTATTADTWMVIDPIFLITETTMAILVFITNFVATVIATAMVMDTVMDTAAMVDTWMRDELEESYFLETLTTMADTPTAKVTVTAMVTATAMPMDMVMPMDMAMDTAATDIPATDIPATAATATVL